MSDSLFLINQVIHDLQEDCDYRILWTASAPDSPSYWLRLPGTSNVPEEISLRKVSEGIEAGRYSFAPDVWRPVKNGEAGETALRLRDKAWELIRDAVTNEPDIYDAKKRRTILLGIEEATGTKVPNLYKYIGKYWRYGKIPDALLPDYSACGKRRDPYKESSKRAGRPKVPGAAGKKLESKDLRNFRKAFTKYYLGEEKLSLEKTYIRMVGDFYTVKDKDGNSVAPMDPDEVPSRQQFLYWHRKNRDTLEEVLSRDGERSYQLKSRGETGRTETHLRGPGIACQIDATTADIYLVSRDDRTAIIGRPTMYFQMDSFSHIVTGMNISLDPPSWENAARTILNSVEDKVEYCAKYGITITEGSGPACTSLPSSSRTAAKWRAVRQTCCASIWGSPWRTPRLTAGISRGSLRSISTLSTSTWHPSPEKWKRISGSAAQGTTVWIPRWIFMNSRPSSSGVSCSTTTTTTWKLSGKRPRCASSM